MNSPYDPPVSQLISQKENFRLPIVAAFFSAMIFSICIIGSFFLPVEVALEFIFPSVSLPNVQPGLNAAVLLALIILAVWLSIYFVVTRISKRFTLGVLVSSSIVWLLLFLLIAFINNEARGGEFGFNVAAINTFIGFIAGTLASLAISKRFRKRTVV